MKKLILTSAFLLNLVVMAFANEPAILKYKSVKMYRQPGQKTEVMRRLTAADEVILVRKFNTTWSIVTVNGEAGYVLNSSLRILPAVEKATK